MDYFERAKRMEEIALLEKQYEDQRESDKKFHEDQEEQRVRVAYGSYISCVESNDF